MQHTRGLFSIGVTIMGSRFDGAGGKWLSGNIRAAGFNVTALKLIVGK